MRLLLAATTRSSERKTSTDQAIVITSGQCQEAPDGIVQDGRRRDGLHWAITISTVVTAGIGAGMGSMSLLSAQATAGIGAGIGIARIRAILHLCIILPASSITGSLIARGSRQTLATQIKKYAEWMMATTGGEEMRGRGDDMTSQM